MALQPVKHSTWPSNNYGTEKIYLEQCIIGQGAAAPIIQAASVNGGTAPPGAAEIVSITRTSAGLYVVTFADAYYARIYGDCAIDDTAGIGAYATVGNWQNLNTSTPAVCSIHAWNAAGTTPTDIPLNTVAMLVCVFKKSYTGSAA